MSGVISLHFFALLCALISVAFSVSFNSLSLTPLTPSSSSVQEVSNYNPLSHSSKETGRSRFIEALFPEVYGIPGVSGAASASADTGDVVAVGRTLGGSPWVSQRIRPRRVRSNAVIRSMVQEAVVRPSNLIQPLFIHDQSSDEAIDSMPGQFRLSLNSMMQAVGLARQYGVKSIMLFPKVATALKSAYGEESYNPAGIVGRAIEMIKREYPDVIVFSDVALDPYSSEGHDGIVLHASDNDDDYRVKNRDGEVLNDVTIEQLAKQSLMHARAGVDFVCPSDMQDGRIKVIRDTLDMNGFSHVGIVAYSAKYASAYYGPFRDALKSHPGKGDKKGYQQDPSNLKESILEALLDQEEGADMLMVKPALPYLDVIQTLKLNTKRPLAAYQVSGEYSMIKAAALQGWIDEKATVMESIKSIRRAGSDAIITYYATQLAKWLHEDQQYEPSY